MASAIDPTEARQKVQADSPEILMEGEEFEFAFAWTRDQVYFSSHRIIFKDVQGLTGSSTGWKSIPYNTIKAFYVKTAGSLDMDCELKIFPSGMTSFDCNFKKGGGIDVFALQKFINKKMFHPESVGEVLAVSTPAQPVDDAGASKWMDLICGDNRAVDPKVVETQLKSNPPILDEDEVVDMAFKCGRDTAAFTSRRLLVMDVQGWSGKKVMYKSYLWSCIRAFATETPGAFLDRDAEMKLWTSIGNEHDNKFGLDFKKSSVDIMSVQKYLADRLLGQDTAPRSDQAKSLEGAKDQGGGWQAWLGDMRQIDAVQADEEFHTTTPILQGSETVEMAFKGKRDMTLFTTKRLLQINPQGWTGKKISYTSVPWTSVQAFAVQSAGSWFDKDSEMMIWTDIFYDIEKVKRGDHEERVPVPGMSYIEQDFKKDQVDLPTIGRYLASKCAKLGAQSSHPDAPVSKELLTKVGEEGGMEKFIAWLGSNFRQVDADEMEVAMRGDCSVLLPDEKVRLAFVCGRDTLILTSHRALVIDVKGWTGKKILYFSIPYTKIRSYEFESAGSWDADAEMKLYIKAPWYEQNQGCLSQDFKKGKADIIAIQRFISAQIIGTADGSSAKLKINAAEPTAANQFLGWLGAHQISAEEASEKLRSDPEILLPDETVDMAFKCGRDMSVFTTKRFLFVNVKGWTSNRVNYTSVPYKYIASFSVTGAASHPFDQDSSVKLFTDGLSDKIKVSIRKGQGDLPGAYAFLLKKCIKDKCNQVDMSNNVELNEDASA